MSLCIFLICITYYVIYAQKKSHTFGIYIFQLKSNIAIFLQTKSGKRILINGGSNSEIIRKLTKVLPFYSRHIDSVISTNEEDKNITGLISVIDRYSVDEAYMQSPSLITTTIASSSNKIYEEYLRELKAKKIPIHHVMKGNVIKIDDDTEIEVLFPVDANLFKYSKASSPELILKIFYGHHSFLLLGNVSKKIQKYISSNNISSNSTIHSDVLIVPHGLSKFNIDEKLLEILSPKIVVYSQSKSEIIKDAYNVRELGSILLNIESQKIKLHKI